MGQLHCLRLVPPGLCLLSLSPRLTFHLQAVPDGAVSQRLCSHLRESWAMLEGENSVRSVTVMQRSCAAARALRGSEDVGRGNCCLMATVVFTGQRMFSQPGPPKPSLMRQNYYSGKILQTPFLEVRVPRLSGVLQLWV